jgi:hypothetical protein
MTHELWGNIEPNFYNRENINHLIITFTCEGNSVNCSLEN